MKKIVKKPPKLAKWIIHKMANSLEKLSIVGDLEEEFNEIVDEKGRIKARFWYLCQIFILIPTFILSSFYWSGQMFKNYLKIFIRNLKRHKAYSFINIAGLGMGMACCIAIILFIQDEFSYDKFNENAQWIYRVATKREITPGKEGSTKTWSWMVPNLINDFPEVINAVRIFRYGGVLSHGGKYFGNAHFFVDPSILNIFTFPLIKGDKENALRDPNSALVTEDLAEKYFGEEDPLGKVLTVDGKYNFKITGILQNIPENSHFKFNFIGHFDRLREIYGDAEFQSGLLVRTYLLLDKNASPRELENKFHNFVVKYKDKNFASKHKYFLQPLTSIHLYSNLAVEFEKNSDISYSYALSAVAFLILILAFINFVNLSTARASRRAKEVGMRKVIGASRPQVFRQFLGESIFFSFVALLFAIALVKLFLPIINSLLNKDLTLDFRGSLFLYIGLILLTLSTGFISGSYPAIFLSSFQPVEVIKGNLRRGTMVGVLFRKGLIVFQFAISLVFIIGTIVVFRQVNFIKNKNLGFDREYVIKLPLDRNLRRHYETIKTEVLRNPHISRVTASLMTPGKDRGLSLPFVLEGFQEEEFKLDLCDVDHNFFDFFGIDIIEGRNFSEEITSDTGSAFILNEAAIRKIGWKSPIGKQIRCDGFGVKGKVIGVAKNFHNVSLREEIKPSIFRVYPQYFSLFLRIQPTTNIQTIASFLEKKVREFSPNIIFSYSFIDEDIAVLYRGEKKVGQVFSFSSFLSIFIACLGLFALSSFSAEQRIKEIGIRKVLGASASKIVLLLSKDFLKLVIISNIIAWPAAYFVMNRWLEDFAYRISIGIGTFITAAALAGCLTVLTVSFQALKAALANPVDSLRYE
jgi:putative ABC transport system permease protein